MLVLAHLRGPCEIFGGASLSQTLGYDFLKIAVVDQEPVCFFPNVHSEATFTGCWLCFRCFTLLDPHLNVDMAGAHLLQCFFFACAYPASSFSFFNVVCRLKQSQTTFRLTQWTVIDTGTVENRHFLLCKEKPGAVDRWIKQVWVNYPYLLWRSICKLKVKLVV